MHIKKMVYKLAKIVSVYTGNINAQRSFFLTSILQMLFKHGLDFVVLQYMCSIVF